MKLSHSKLILISGLIWFAIGLYLLQLGLNLLIGAINADLSTKGAYPLINFMKTYVGTVESASIALVCIALLVGYLKGRFVLAKTAIKGVQRILSFPDPASIGIIYNARYCLLIGLMVCLGISIKVFGLSHDIRGVVDVAIGSALINGSMSYFKRTKDHKDLKDTKDTAYCP